MKIQHFRNATMTIEVDDKVILVDPMIGPMRTIPPFALFRFKARRNPIIPLPDVCRPILKRVTHCLITHRHPDHLDAAAEKYLRAKQIPITCSVKDEKVLLKKGLNVIQAIDYWQRTDFLGGKIEGIPARHGYGFVAELMGYVMGCYIQWPHQPSIYLSADTIYTKAVDKVLNEYKPAISVVACGTAQLDIFKPLLMTIDDIIKFVKNAPNKVIANHLEALNHCPTTRNELREILNKKGLMHKTFIPEDGEIINM